MKKLVVIYTRGSSATQSHELQKASAIRYLDSINLSGDEETVIYLSDHNVPAKKLKTNPQTQLAKVFNLIEEGKVAKLIVYKRDRLARDFHEFLDLTKIIIKHNVEVIFTAHNELPFSYNLEIEALYGILDQLERQAISERMKDAHKLRRLKESKG
jgi:DNA invertase Pin-like site-specific DNA recombinase